MPITPLSRRTVLRGLGGVGVALPALEAMEIATRGRAARAQAAKPRRFVLSYGGTSTGAYAGGDELVPATVGRGYDVRRALKPLADLGIRDDVTVVTGLVLPWQQNGEMPPGGRTIEFHYNTVGPQVAGTSTGPGRRGKPKGPTADQLVAGAIAGSTPHKVLAFRVQPASYVGGNQISGDSGRLSWKLGTNGALAPQDPIVSPRLAFESLFAGFTPSDPADARRAQMLLRQRKSVLDLVAGDMQALVPRLGGADRARLQRHFDEVRALEQRLGMAAPTDRRCKQPAHPGADPPIGQSIIAYQGQGQGYTTAAGYSDEDRRADVLTDLIAMAFACDLSRVASYMLTEWKCYMNMFPVAGWKSDMHELTHGAGPLAAVSDAVAWHVKNWGKLVVKLKGLPDADGASILDSTALALVFEGGHGWDPEASRKDSAHSTENMAVLLGGRAGGLRSGVHLPAPGKHPAQAVLTAMHAAGARAEALGEVKGVLAELLG
jgi:hypothetical protein